MSEVREKLIANCDRCGKKGLQREEQNRIAGIGTFCLECYRVFKIKKFQGEIYQTDEEVENAKCRK